MARYIEHNARDKLANFALCFIYRSNNTKHTTEGRADSDQSTIDIRYGYTQNAIHLLRTSRPLMRGHDHR